MLSVKEAKSRRVCRICEEPVPSGGPAGWTEDFGEMLHPIRVTLNFGEEFAHTECLQKTTQQAELETNDLTRPPTEVEVVYMLAVLSDGPSCAHDTARRLAFQWGALLAERDALREQVRLLKEEPEGRR
jgi:hypothetical protein